jgi:cation:H+ antiporter
MAQDALLTLVGLVFLLGGGEALVRGASAIARSTGVPPLIVGLTIVAFGTSAPELAVNVIAAWRGSGDLSFGNILGSNMANIGLILGCAGLVRALEIHSAVVVREIPMMLLATALALILAMDGYLRGGVDSFDRGDGLVLLLLFCVFLYYTVGGLARQRSSRENPLADLGTVSGEPRDVAGLFRNSLLTMAGMGALLAGAELTVDGAIGLARAVGVSEVVIGLTVVAIGTSLPELATALIATTRGHVDLAVGNVVGSNIFNILLVAGATATIRPIPIPAFGYWDLGVTILLSVALWFVSMTRNQRIVRAEAMVLLGIYLSYMLWRTLTFPGSVE